MTEPINQDQGKNSRVSWLVLLLVTALLAVFTWPFVMRQKRKADQTKAVSGLRQIGLALFEFETAYGQHPDALTAPEVAAQSKLDLDLSGHSANAYFRQLIAAEVVDSETMFYAKTSFTHKPDNRFDTNETALAPGEVGYGYVMDDRRALKLKDKFTRVVVCAPLAFDGNTVSDRRFDATIDDGRGIALLHDNSVTSFMVHRQTGEPIMVDGKSFHEPYEDPISGEKVTPVIAAPLPRR